MSEKHAPWCARYMPCTCMAPGGPNTSAAERLSWVLQRYEEGRKVLETTVAKLRESEARAEKAEAVLARLFAAKLNEDSMALAIARFECMSLGRAIVERAALVPPDDEGGR